VLAALRQAGEQAMDRIRKAANQPVSRGRDARNEAKVAPAANAQP